MEWAQQLAPLTNTHKPIWAADITQKSGAKTFAAADYEQFWTHINNTPTQQQHFYEVIRDKPCHMFFDFDTKECHRLWELMKPCLNMFVEEITGETPTHIVLDASDQHKKSIHVITKIKQKFLLKSPTQGKQFITCLEQLFLEENETFGCDKTIYSKSRCFRLWNSSKMGKGRPFTNQQTFNFENFCQSLVQFGDYPSAETGIKFNNNSNQFPIQQCNEVTDAIKTEIDGNNRTRKMPFSWVFINHVRGRKCPFLGKKHKSNNVYYKYDLLERGQAVIRCFKCQGKQQQVAFSKKITNKINAFLNKWSINIHKSTPNILITNNDPRLLLQKIKNEAKKHWNIDIKSYSFKKDTKNSKKTFPMAIMCKKNGKTYIQGYKIHKNEQQIRKWNTKKNYITVTLAEAPTMCKNRIEFLQKIKNGEQPQHTNMTHVEQQILQIAVSSNKEATNILNQLENNHNSTEKDLYVSTEKETSYIPIVSDEAIDAIMAMKNNTTGNKRKRQLN